VVLEENLPLEPNRSYPVVLDGERACPPEDVGGPPGYADLLRSLKDPEDERYAQIREQIGDFDAERFDPGEVVFSSSKE
jgi:hypothetical protein